MNTLAPLIQAVEERFQRELPGRWTRLGARELEAINKSQLVVGWRIDVPTNRLSDPNIDHFLILLDAQFPHSQVRAAAPQATYLAWPHVEDTDGLLCLPPTRINAPAADRVLQALCDAETLFRMDEAARRAEFNAEFRQYWSRKKSDNTPRTLSLVTHLNESREIAYYRDPVDGFYVLADGDAALKQWLVSIGKSRADIKTHSTFLIFRDELPIPSEYPETGKDILNGLSPQHAEKVITSNTLVPLLLAGRTQTGIVAYGVLVKTNHPVYRSGSANVKARRLEALTKKIAESPVQRVVVERVDFAWVTGRDSNAEALQLRSKHVVLVGCGSLGSSIAKHLVQSGVGHLTLIDVDLLESHNTCRHVLGLSSLGLSKARALADSLSRDYPHIEIDFQIFRAQDLTLLGPILESVDLIISAGIDFEGDAALNDWRAKRESPPMHLCTWVEEYAVCGHAISLVRGGDLLAQFDEQGYPTVALTDWPARVVQTEPGCSNTFQPHSIVDLANTSAMAAKLALQMLLGQISSNCRRAWLGDLSQLASLGGVPRSGFNQSNTLREIVLDGCETEMSPLAFTLADGRQHIEFADAVAAHIKQHLQTKESSREAGGQLFGRIVGNVVYVDIASGPSNRDRRRRNSFQSNSKAAQQTINHYHEQGLTYLGEWHTHAENMPSPSRDDIEAMKAILNRSTLSVTALLLLIAGRVSGVQGWCVLAFESGGTHQVASLAPH